MSETLSNKAQRVAIGAENLRGLADAEIPYIKAILTAIEVLAADGSQQKAVIDLAKCAAWVVENVDSWIQCSCDDLVSLSRENC